MGSLIVSEALHSPELYVSVPSRGNGFLNKEEDMTVTQTAFPSPRGAMGSLIADEPVTEVPNEGFRPLAGQWVP